MSYCSHRPSEVPELESVPDRGTQEFRVVNRFFVVRRTDGTGGINEDLIPLMMQDLNYGFRDTPFVYVRASTRASPVISARRRARYRRTLAMSDPPRYIWGGLGQPQGTICRGFRPSSKPRHPAHTQRTPVYPRLDPWSAGPRTKLRNGAAKAIR